VRRSWDTEVSRELRQPLGFRSHACLLRLLGEARALERQRRLVDERLDARRNGSGDSSARRPGGSMPTTPSTSR